jgi:LysM repeat protein
MKRRASVLLGILLLAACLPLTAWASPAAGSGVYVVRHGDTLAGIARRHCTTWQAIYDLNAATLGGNPNQIYPGLVLTVPLGCGGGYPPPPGGGGVYDRGPGPHAWGHVWGGKYVVARGDTLYSVSRRFGLTVPQMAAANGLCAPYWIYAGQWLVIGGGYLPGPQPKPLPDPFPWPQPKPHPKPLPKPLPDPQPLPPTTGMPYITIVDPIPDSVLPPTFSVSGMGGALGDGQIVIRARDREGALLAEETTIIEGPGALTNGEGPWHITLNVYVPANMGGTLEAATPDGAAVIVQPVIVPVTFTGGGPQSIVYAAGQCEIVPVLRAPLYAYPGGPVVVEANSTLPVAAIRGVYHNDRRWYELAWVAGEPSVWLPETSVTSAGTGCGW